MARTLLVTNDFPPTIGGIQSYLRDFLDCLDSAEVVVFASTQDSEAAENYDAKLPFPVIRWPRKVMLPTAATARWMQQIIVDYDIETVWFGAAAPLGLLAKSAREAGASRVVATTHGHEVGWSMLPVARQALREIGRNSDVITYISDYTLRRLRRPFGPGPQWVHLPSAVNTDVFHPASESQRRQACEHFGLDPTVPTIVCISRLVPRKGQDQLIRALPHMSERCGRVQLLIIGRGRYRSTLESLAKFYRRQAPLATVIVQEAADRGELGLALSAADIFAMPARTRGGGLDVEGLGIVYLEAQAAGVPVIAGDSGGAPETVTHESGIVVRGARLSELVDALVALLQDPRRREAMGKAGRLHVEDKWTWSIMGQRLQGILH